MVTEGTAQRNGPIHPPCGGEQDAENQSGSQWDTGKLVEQKKENWTGQHDTLCKQTFEEHRRPKPLSILRADLHAERWTTPE